MIGFTVLLHLFLYFYVKNGHFSKKLIFSRNWWGGGLISTDGVNFGIKSLVSASGTLHRVGAIKFKNEPITTPPTNSYAI